MYTIVNQIRYVDLQTISPYYPNAVAYSHRRGGYTPLHTPRHCFTGHAPSP